MNYIAESTFEARPVFALSFVDRLRGLLGHDRKLHKNEVLCIMPCKSIHTYGMRYSIDVAFINERGTVIETLCNVNPNQHCKCKHAKWVIERYSREDPWLQVGQNLRLVKCGQDVPDAQSIEL